MLHAGGAARVSSNVGRTSCMTTIAANPLWGSLLECQRKALEHIQESAACERPRARDDIRSILERAGLNESLYDGATRSAHAHARVGLHFHPERLSRTGRSVAQSLLQSGIYTSQFETGMSSGSPSAFAGGERDLWESRLFGGAYHRVGTLPSSRPKYGALEVMYHPDGPAPRFGSCYFLLRPEASKRSTYTFGGSHEQGALERTGTFDILDPVLAPLLAQLEQRSGAFGVDHLTVAGFLDQLMRGLSKPFRNPQSRPLGRALDSFIEVQVHGEIHLSEDVERCVADPAFRDHRVGETLAAISAKYGIPLFWHPGFTLPVDEVPEVFRGCPVRPLAERIAGRGVLDAAKIGSMANTVELEPDAWEGWASYEAILAQFRRLWHVLVLIGEPNKALHRMVAPRRRSQIRRSRRGRHR